MKSATVVTCVRACVGLTSTSYSHLSLHSPQRPPRGFRLSPIHPHKHSLHMSAAQVLASNGAHTFSPPKLAINGRSHNGPSDRLQIISNEKEFTYVPC